MKKIQYILLASLAIGAGASAASLPEEAAAMAEQFNMNLSTAALNGGEDYELLFTVPLTVHDKVSEMKGVKVIGHITRPELGNYLVGRDGGEVELKAQGWNSLNE